MSREIFFPTCFEEHLENQGDYKNWKLYASEIIFEFYDRNSKTGVASLISKVGNSVR